MAAVVVSQPGDVRPIGEVSQANRMGALVAPELRTGGLTPLSSGPHVKSQVALVLPPPALFEPRACEEHPC
jgi:hypothetical protein